jgi:hypothetical protein
MMFQSTCTKGPDTIFSTRVPVAQMEVFDGKNHRSKISCQGLFKHEKKTLTSTFVNYNTVASRCKPGAATKILLVIKTALYYMPVMLQKAYFHGY